MRPVSRPASGVRIGCLAAALAGLLAAGARAEVPGIAVDEARCVPMEDNGLITARVQPEVGGATVRLYFRWREHGTFYWVPMNAAGGGRYWAVLPKPEKDNENVERYVSVVDALAHEISRSASAIIPVQRDCKVQLDAKQKGQADNLVIGETALPQKGREVLGFLCDGIVSRVDANGILRADDACRTCVVAWWQRKAILIPAAVGLTTGVVVIHKHPHPEPSPHRP
jgi:hypothetical protein